MSADALTIKHEILLQEDETRYVIFPIQHYDIWEKFIQHKKLIWFVDEVDLTRDLADWKLLSDDEQHFIKHVLAFFASSDGVVMENLGARFLNEIQLAEARSFYAMQLFIENEHSIMYSRLIDTLIDDIAEKQRLLSAIQHMPAIAKKANWARRWITSCNSFACRLLAFAAVEGIFFSGSFCCIYWLKERGIMPGLCMSNDFIARDEGLHTDFAILLYTKYVANRIPEAEVYEIIGEAVSIEKEFITESLPCSLLGMNSNLMSEYIEYIANRLLQQLGYRPLYEAKQPFSFMDRICLQSITNFFDTREVNYQKQVDQDETFGYDDDF